MFSIGCFCFALSRHPAEQLLLQGSSHMYLYKSQFPYWQEGGETAKTNVSPPCVVLVSLLDSETCAPTPYILLHLLRRQESTLKYRTALLEINQLEKVRNKHLKIDPVA